MTSPQQRQRDPQSLGRGVEVAFVMFAGAGCVLGLASALFGGGWVWPAGADTIGQVLVRLLAGHPGRGLPPELTSRVPGPTAVYAGVAVVEVLTVLPATVAGTVFCATAVRAMPAGAWPPRRGRRRPGPRPTAAGQADHPTRTCERLEPVPITEHLPTRP